jgi:hypothetical protein
MPENRPICGKMGGIGVLGRRQETEGRRRRKKGDRGIGGSGWRESGEQGISRSIIDD